MKKCLRKNCPYFDSDFYTNCAYYDVDNEKCEMGLFLIKGDKKSEEI